MDWQSLSSIISTIIGLWVGSIEWRLRDMATTLYYKPDRQEVTNLIELHQRELKAAQTDIRDDIHRLEEILAKIYDKLMNQGI